jgi:hypothetical protein
MRNAARDRNVQSGNAKLIEIAATMYPPQCINLSLNMGTDFSGLGVNPR